MREHTCAHTCPCGPRGYYPGTNCPSYIGEADRVSCPCQTLLGISQALPQLDKAEVQVTGGPGPLTLQNPSPGSVL